MTDKIYYELWSQENVVGCYHKLTSRSFKFLLEAAFHQYESTKINRLYIEKHNNTKYFKNITPNCWSFFLDFLGSKKHDWSAIGIIDMKKIKRDPNYHA